MKAPYSSITVYQSTWHNIPEGLNLHLVAQVEVEVTSLYPSVLVNLSHILQYHVFLDFSFKNA
jgi:hypothetical protein